jgi:hypothetical protein
MESMKKLLLTILAFICININLLAQIVQINGIVTDSISHSVLQYVSIVLIDKNDSIINGTMSNSDGQFSLNISGPQNEFTILIKHIGYIDSKIRISRNGNNINLGTVELVPSEYLLEQVVIEGQVKYMTRKFDRKVFSISDAKIASAQTIFDLLRNLPGVVVDENGNVRYKGAEATFYVDDILLKYSYPKVEMVPFENVDKIELIDATMRTGGDGRGGIINIKLKNSKEEGLSGFVSTSIQSINFSEIDRSKEFLNLNYKKKGFTFFVNSSFENNVMNTNTSIAKKLSLNESDFNQKYSSVNGYNRYANYNYTGFIYKPSENSKFNMSIAFLNSKDKALSDSRLIEINAPSRLISNQYNNHDNTVSDQYNKGVTLAYWHKMDTIDSYFKMVGNYTIFDGSSEEESTYHFDQVNSVHTDSIDTYRNYRYFLSKTAYLSFVYNHSFNRKSRLSATYNVSMAFIDSSVNKHFSFDQLQLHKSQFNANKNYEHNLSLRTGTQLNKWKLDCGLNISVLFIKGNFLRYITEEKDTMMNLEMNFRRLLPSTTISYQINERNEIKLTLSKTSNFPYFNQLSDFIDKGNKYVWNSGNSSLIPVDFYSVYLGYSFDNEKLNVSAEYFYNYTNNEVANLSIPLTSLLILNKPYNITQVSNTGIDLSSFLRFNKSLNFSFSSSLFHTFYNNNTLKGLSEEYSLTENKDSKRQFGYYLKCNTEYQLRGYFFMLYLNYYSRELTFDGYEKESFNSSINLSKKYLNNKLRISVGLNNILAELLDHGSYSEYFGVTSASIINSSRYKTTYFFSVQYSFLHGDRGTKDLK